MKNTVHDPLCENHQKYGYIPPPTLKADGRQVRNPCFFLVSEMEDTLAQKCKIPATRITAAISLCG